MSGALPIENRRILAVDDEPAILQAYVDFLGGRSGTARRSSRGGTPGKTGEAFELVAVQSAEEVLSAIERALREGSPIAGGFFDVRMPGKMDGIEAIMAAWKLDPRLHCTIVTAYQDRDVHDLNALFGPGRKDQWDYLSKPFLAAEIVQKARQMAAAWNRKRSLEAALEELQQAQNQLVHSERLAAIGQLARGVSHEFGNYLQRILGQADLVLARAEGSEGKNRESVSLIADAAEQASLIVRSLQTLSKGGDRGRDLIPLGEAVTAVLKLAAPELKKHAIQVEVVREAAPQVLGNRVEIEQVILNLVINAIHAMPTGGRLEIGCRRADPDGLAEVARRAGAKAPAEAASVWIRDTGPGIAPEIQAKIFEFGFTTKGDAGSGLGLAISRQIAETHGGTLACASEPGKGACFTLILPGVSK